ncbi:DNA-binding MarR family transcriptional regulator [Herbihabitans rhizosphaerae]|uniref:DNA-binding MarR family transcriptional regulator n=1 Tax=Herbihabitans rhizosphaerae TaxID=1872711 RepID=A0A4Q7KCK0_9PSEU|nr:MarR family transcriptional regulator [Herbihabitans rhizosphaerae]RZS31218.1 DNA-binding MarR family transcriptional regulator [Herbihabitans rhizosphaerae]
MSDAPLVPGSIAEHTGCLLVKVGQVLYRLAEESLADLGLRVRHYSVLQALADNGAMSQLGIGGHLRIDPATMVSTLDDLESAGYAARVRDPGDRRRYLVETTAAGKKRLARANRMLSDLDDLLLSDLPQTKRRALHGSLATLAAGDVLPAAFDASRFQAGSRKMSSASSPVAPSGR